MQVFHFFLSFHKISVSRILFILPDFQIFWYTNFSWHFNGFSIWGCVPVTGAGQLSLKQELAVQGKGCK